MKKFFLFAALMTAAAGSMTAQVVSVVAQRVDDDSVRVGMKKIDRRLEDAYIVSGLGKRTLYVNEEVTTHIIMPEPIRLVDISTQKIAGNQCADNIVRIKPVNRMFEHELAGTVTVIGERNMVQYDIVYTRQPNLAYSVYKVSNAELDRYSNPSVTMTEGEMARFAYAIYNSPRRFYGIRQSKYGMTIRVNNIYTLNDYFFIDYSIENRSKIKYDIDEVRVKLTDKKQSKATNSQTVELSPVWSLNGARSFQKAYRNVIVIDKLTFPNEKVLSLEISERQISGRVITVNIDYSDILNADSIGDGSHESKNHPFGPDDSDGHVMGMGRRGGQPPHRERGVPSAQHAERRGGVRA